MNLFLENLRNDDPIGDNPFLLNLENPEPEGGVLASIQRAGGRLGRSIGGTLEATGDISTAGMVAGALGIDYESPVTSAGRTLAAASDEFLARPEIQTPSTQKLYDSSKGDFFDAEAWDPSILLTEEFYTEHAPEQLTYMVPFFAANAAGGMPAAVGANMVMEGGTAYRDARDKGSSHYEALRAAAIVAGAQVPLTVLTQGAASKIPGTGVARSLARGTTDVAGELVEETGQSIASQGAATTYDPNAEVNVGQALEEGAMAIPFAGGMQATSSALSRTVAAAVPAPKDNPFLKNIQEQQDRIHEAEQARIEQIGLSAEAGADVRSAMAQRVLDEMEDEQAAAEPVETPEAPAPAPTSASTVPTTRTTTEADGPSLADAVRALGGIFVDRDTAMQGEVARVVGESGSGADLFRQGILTRNRSGSDPDEVARQLEEQYPDIANNIRGTGGRLVGSDLLSALEDRENLFKRPLRDAGISENQEQEAVRQQSVVAKLDEEIAKATDPDITEALQARRQELQDGLDAPEERRSGDDEPLPFALRAVEEYQANLQIAGVKGTLKLVGAKKGIEQRLVRDGKRFGVDVVFVEGTSYGTPAMTTRDGKIVIRRGETNAGYKKLFAHETVHAIRRTDPELYGKLRAAIRKYSPGIAEEGQQEYLRRASRVSEVVAERIGQDPDTLEEEGIAQTVESFSHLLEDQAALETMAREDPSLFQQIKEWVEKKLDEFFATGARARIRRETEVGRALLNYQQMLTMAERRAGQIEGQDRRAAAAMPENQPKTEETEAGDQTVIDDDATKRKVPTTAKKGGGTLEGTPLGDNTPERVADRKAGEQTSLFALAVNAERTPLAPAFYSQLRRSIEGFDFRQMPAKDLLARIRKTQGIKPEELEETKFAKWLEVVGGRVSKEEALDFIDTNQVKVEVVEKGGDQPPPEFPGMEEYGDSVWLLKTERGRYRIEKLQNNMFRIETPGGASQSPKNTFEEAEAEVERMWNNAEGSDLRATGPGATRHQGYVLPGAVEGSYREMLLTLPEPDISELDGEIEAIYRLEERDADTDRRLEELTNRRDDLQYGETYQSGHWDERNVLAHIRFNERTDADGNRVLFVEEVQSDWHQAGRKKGYGKQSRRIFQENEKWMIEGFGDLLLFDSRGEAETYLAGAPSQDKTTGVPDAPFKKTWPELSFKHVLRYAAENGFEKVAWTSGEQQNERYDLSKQVDLIQWGKRDGDKRVGIVVKSGANIRFTVDEQGKAAPDPEASFELDANISGKPIDEIVGKEMADKILAEESGNLEGKGLKIEGQGMKGFYDSMLPKAVGKYVKKLDKKHPGVGVMDVAGRQTTEADRHYEGPEHTSDEIRALAVQSNVASVQVREQMEEIAESVESGDSLVEAMRYFGSDTAAQALGGELVRDHVEGSQQLGIEVTDALRSSVMGGQAMFALEDEKKVTPAASSPKPQPVTFSDLVSSIDSQIAESVNPFDPTETKAQVVQRKMQDALAPLKRLEKEMLRQGVRITETSDPYLQEEFRRSRTRNRIEHDEKRFVDPIVKTTGAAEIDYDELSTFLIARHAEERNATIAERRGKPGAWSGMSDEVARHIQEAAAKGRQFRLKTNDQGRVTGQEVFSRPNKKRAAAFKRIGKLFDAMNNQRIDLMVRDGLLTAEAREAYRQWKHYAPLRTDMDEGRTKGTGQGLSIRGREHKSALGRQSLSDDPLAFAVDQMVSAHIRAEKNRVGLSLLALARQFPSSIWSVDRKLTKLQLGENGLVREVVYDPSGLQATDEERARTVSVKEKGVEHQILFAPEYAHIAKALKLMHADGVEGVTALVGSAVRFLAGMNTRWNPAFLPFNFLRDIGTGTLTVTGEHGIKMGASVARNAPKAIRAMWWTSNTGQRQRSKMERLGMRPNEEWLRYANEYRESGAPISFMNLDTVEDRAKRIRREVSSLQKGNIRQKSRTLALHAMDWIADSNDAVENGTRLAAYVAMRRQGRSVATSGSYAKNLTTQFERRGEFGHSINAWYMFSNAAIQGLARVGQAAQYPGVKVLMGSTVATAALMDIMNRALAGEDDDGENHYDKIEDHIKRRYMILMFPDGSGRRVQLPLPFVYGWFWTTGTMMGDMAHHPDHDIGKGVGEIATAFLDSMNPFGGAIDATTAFPTLLQPPVQHIANRNWKGKPITPKSHGQPIAPSELHWPDPNPTLKAVTKWLNEATGGNEVEPGFVSISPNVIEHYARFLTGGAGATGGRFLNLADKVVRGEPIQHHEIPVWRRLYAEPNPRYLKKRFREFEGELKTAQAKVRVAREKKDKNAYDAAREEHRAAFAVQELIKNTNRYIRNMETKIKTAKPDSSRKFEEQLHNHLARVNRAINRKRSELRSSTGGRR